MPFGALVAACSRHNSGSSIAAENEQYVLKINDALGTGSLNSGTLTFDQDGHSEVTGSFSSASSGSAIAALIKTALRALLTAQSLPDTASDVTVTSVTADSGYLYQFEIEYVGGNAGTNMPDLTISVSTLAAGFAAGDVTAAITQAAVAEVLGVYEQVTISTGGSTNDLITLQWSDGSGNVTTDGAGNIDGFSLSGWTVLAGGIGATYVQIEFQMYEPKNTIKTGGGGATSVTVDVAGVTNVTGVAQQQTITMPSAPAPDGGTFDAAGASGLAYDASTAAVDTALDATTPPWDVTGTAGVTYLLTARDFTDNALISVDGSALTKGTSVPLTKTQDGG